MPLYVYSFIDMDMFNLFFIQPKDKTEEDHAAGSGGQTLPVSGSSLGKVSTGKSCLSEPFYLSV